jgi:hypothetical protein
MRKLSPEETPEILPLKSGRSTQLRTLLLQLAVGEVAFMPKEEWKTKNGPSFIVAHIKKTHGFLYAYGSMTDGSGWMFKRVA